VAIRTFPQKIISNHLITNVIECYFFRDGKKYSFLAIFFSLIRLPGYNDIRRNNMRRFANHRRHPGKFGVMFLVFAVVMALVVMTLWNAIIPGLFGLKTIGF
jgi:hypothetical protein